VDNKHAGIIDKCAGCGHISRGVCMVYLDPAAKWRAGNCVMCTTVVRGKTSTIKRVGQPKGKKKKK